MNKFHKGFTLIELVVVIAILGILAGIAIPRFLDAQASAKGAKIVADLRTIDSAAMIYQAKTGSLPTSIAALTTNNTAVSPAQYQLLASWPVPKTGTFIVAQLSGGDKTFKDITAAEYTLVNGRGEYNGQTVEYYLGTAENNSVVAALEAQLGQSGNEILKYLMTKLTSRLNDPTTKYLDSENTLKTSYDKEVEDALTKAGVDTANCSWALRYSASNNTVKLYVTDHKLTYNNDRGTTVNVQIYTGTVSNGSVTSWSGPISGTAGVISKNGNGVYAKLDV
jgi:prepilin-type N-terminal cleavage/methylation domain-containing protein